MKNKIGRVGYADLIVDDQNKVRVYVEDQLVLTIEQANTVRMELADPNKRTVLERKL